MTATMLTKEYGHLSPWIGIGAYGVAACTGLMRMANNKHVPPVLGFSWKKVLKKEKNGVFAMLAVYCLFDVVWEWSSGRREPDVVLWLLAGIAGMAYMALKMIKRHTGLLDEPGR